MQKKLYRSRTDKKVAGVCGGFAQYLNIDSTIIRLIFAFLVIFAGTGLLAYLICAIVLPEEPENGGYTNYTDVNGQDGGFTGGNNL